MLNKTKSYEFLPGLADESSCAVNVDDPWELYVGDKLDSSWIGAVSLSTYSKEIRLYFLECNTAYLGNLFQFVDISKISFL